jgi:hypothetical protein
MKGTPHHAEISIAWNETFNGCNLFASDASFSVKDTQITL